MTEIQSITTASWEQQPPPQLKNFPIIIPDGVLVNKIYACILTPGIGPAGILTDFAEDFAGDITLNLTIAFSNTNFIVFGFQGETLVAEYEGIATDLERLDQIQLRAV